MKFTTRAKAMKEVGVSYLGGINLSSKIEKNKKVGVYTYVLYLAPAGTSGYNVCPYSTPECRMGCLHSSGRVKIEDYAGTDRIKTARIKKTILFHEHQEFFMAWMIEEIKAFKAKAKREGYYFSVRINGTSDIEWENTKYKGQNLMEIFSDVQFYDYTKNWKRFEQELPINYHLTFSFTGRNMKQSLSLLSKGFNVAVVFTDKNFPEIWNGYPVINGDLTDYRPYDGNGVVVGLKYKELANKEFNVKVKNSCFVVQTAVPVLV